MTEKVIRIRLDSKTAEKNAKDLDKAVVGVGKSSDRTVFSMNKLAAAIAAAISVQQVISYVDAWTRLENQLKRTTSTSDELLKVSGDLLKIANDTRAPIEETASLYTNLSIATSRLGYSYEQNIGITKTINNLMLESGKSAQDVAGAIRQLGQAFDKGVLNGDEFVSVAEGMPGILRAIEVQTGKTRKEIKEMAEKGQLDVQLLASALTSYADEAQKAADKTTRTFEQSTIIARNNVTAFIGASLALGDAVRLAGDGIVLISENLDKLAAIAGAAAALYVARLIPSVVASGVAFATATTQSIAYQAALARMAGVSTTAAVAQTALAGAARAASASMAFLGGPLGVIFLAASALVYFTSQADAAKKATDALSISTENLTKNEAAAAKLRVSDAIDAQNERLERLNANVKLYSGQLKAIADLGGENSKAFKETNDKLTEAKGKYDEVSKSLNQLKDKYIELNNVQAGITYLTPSAASSLTNSEPGVVAPTETVITDIASTGSSAQAEINSARSVTEALKLELETRRQISDAYREAAKVSATDTYEYERALLQARMIEDKAIADQKLADDAIRREEQRRLALEDDALTDEEKFVINQYYDEQERLQRELHQETLNSIEKKGADERLRIAEAEKIAKQQLVFDMLSSGVAILEAFGSKSEKSQKRFAKLSIAADTAQGIGKGVAMGLPAGIPAIAWAVANGKKALDRLNSNGGGGGGGGSIPAAVSTPNQDAPALSNRPAFQQKRVIEVRGIGPESRITGQDLVDIMQSDDNVIVALSGAQADAQRRGVI